ncbi:MAG: Uma2 family endonuclease [Ruminococcus sp.]|jgi:Uma2 family endonuclease|nr:Uma2 family endonuclease [Ruminococcus sp.]
MAIPQGTIYTIEDIYALPEGQRAELIDGQMYMMAPPNTVHQRISHFLEWEIENYIRSKNGACEVFAAPFAVFLNKDGQNYVEPDISVVCDKDKIDDKGCNGAPDWIIEITSPSDPQRDYGIKLFKYRTAGVREYWIVNPQKKTITVFDFEQSKRSNQYNWDDDISVCIYEDFIINISNFLSK